MSWLWILHRSIFHPSFRCEAYQGLNGKDDMCVGDLGCLSGRAMGTYARSFANGSGRSSAPCAPMALRVTCRSRHRACLQERGQQGDVPVVRDSDGAG